MMYFHVMYIWKHVVDAVDVLESVNKKSKFFLQNKFNNKKIGGKNKNLTTKI